MSLDAARFFETLVVSMADPNNDTRFQATERLEAMEQESNFAQVLELCLGTLNDPSIDGKPN